MMQVVAVVSALCSCGILVYDFFSKKQELLTKMRLRVISLILCSLALYSVNASQYSGISSGEIADIAGFASTCHVIAGVIMIAVLLLNIAVTLRHK